MSSRYLWWWNYINTLWVVKGHVKKWMICVHCVQCEMIMSFEFISVLVVWKLKYRIKVLNHNWIVKICHLNRMNNIKIFHHYLWVYFCFGCVRFKRQKEWKLYYLSELYAFYLFWQFFIVCFWFLLCSVCVWVCCV